MHSDLQYVSNFMARLFNNINALWFSFYTTSTVAYHPELHLCPQRRLG